MDDFSPVGEVKDEMLEKVFALNVYAPFYTSRKAIEIFLKQESGNIINVSSIGGLFGARAGATYTASKHALVGLTKNTGFMYAKNNIRCNAICPGGVDTEVGIGEFMGNINETGMNIIMPNTAGNPRSGTGMEIATIALFLASEDSSFVNGQCIVADSGWTAF
jgi:NAD(P)-dependent dehydrogenase (short-subunit alcohol dehydrogenase family)